MSTEVSPEHKWIKLALVDTIPEGLSTWRKNHKEIVVIKKKGEIKSIFENRCPHNLKIKISTDYDLEDTTIVCRFHGSRYCVFSGSQIEGPGNRPLNLFPFRINKDKLEIQQ